VDHPLQDQENGIYPQGSIHRFRSLPTTHLMVCCSWCFSYVEKRETPSRREVFPVGVVVHGDPPLPVSGVIKDVIPRQRRFTSVLTERRLLETVLLFKNR
jgi:hypothetical protein